MVILAHRGLICDENTPLSLLRDGYYAIINGYKAPFIDGEASNAAGEERYREGTHFDDVYALFNFDRSLRAACFRYLMMIETLMRSLMSYSFCEVHRPTEAYLRPTCYTPKAHYLRGEASYEADLAWMINTLDYHARGVEEDSPEGGDGSDVRVAHYREKHGGVPLWVLMCELTFGNLKYFYALMRREEQEAVSRRVVTLCATDKGATISREQLYTDLELMVDARNVCAHGERLWNVRMGKGADIRTLLETMNRYLLPADRSEFFHLLNHIVIDICAERPLLSDVIASAKITETITSLLEDTSIYIGQNSQ